MTRLVAPFSKDYLRILVGILTSQRMHLWSKEVSGDKMKSGFFLPVLLPWVLAVLLISSLDRLCEAVESCLMSRIGDLGPDSPNPDSLVATK